MPAERDPDRADLAASALARAKEEARARGYRARGGNGLAARTRPPTDGATDESAGEKPRGQGARRGRRDDPQTLGTAISGLLRENGWRGAAAIGSVFGRWPEIVGADLAAHTRPEHYEDGALTVAADSTVWATQVRLLAATLVRRLNEELGDGMVRRVIVRGPAQPRRQGALRVRGTRGPNGDYG